MILAKKKINKEMIINQTLELINQKGSSQTLTIREIAKVLKCTHPNIYNHYKSMEFLLWDALDKIMKTMIDEVMNKVVEVKDKDKVLPTFFEALLDFYFHNRGWYSLIWYDPVGSEMPEHLKITITLPKKSFCTLLHSLFPELDDEAYTGHISDTVHSYIYGQVMRFMTGRIHPDHLQALRDEIIKTSMELIQFYVTRIKKGDHHE